MLPLSPSQELEYKEFGWKPILKEVKKTDFPPYLEKFLEEITEEYFICEGLELEMVTTREAPWMQARKGLPRDEPSHAFISKESMRDYYKERAA